MSLSVMHNQVALVKCFIFMITLHIIPIIYSSYKYRQAANASKIHLKLLYNKMLHRMNMQKKNFFFKNHKIIIIYMCIVFLYISQKVFCL